MNDAAPDFRLPSVFFTEVFVEQLVTAMTLVPSHHAGGVDIDAFRALLVARTGVGRSSSGRVIPCLSALGLVTIVDGVVGRSRKGDRIRKEMRTAGTAPLASMILRSGFMADQIRGLRSVLASTNDGYYCGRVAAQAVAPQLVGLLGRMADVTIAGHVLIGAQTGIDFDSVWNELPPDGRINWQDVEKRRKAIGDRAELYSIQLERSLRLGAINEIGWVSRDDDGLGYDIEVRTDPRRHIEVKGSSGRKVQFFLSGNEYKVAKRLRTAYEVHYWGEIDLRTDPADDFERLRQLGYPITVVDPSVELAQTPWTMEPSVYRVVRD